MFTFIWLIVTTGFGYFIGDHFFLDKISYAGLIGALVGFFGGLILRYLPEVAGDLLECIGDILT